MSIDLYALQQAILSWYELHGRKTLPWRNLTHDPNRAYKVYVSEIMLQQTQVKTVLTQFYTPFLKCYPTLSTLSQAYEQDVLKAWQGLGYYSRARNLHQSAKICVSAYQAQLPQSLELLQTLPGIGRYTAGAILCFGFDQSVAFVDGNIKRLLSRLFALETPTLKQLQTWSDKILNYSESFNHNQALLDLGAMICSPKNPQCLLCPLNDFCVGKHHPERYPASQKITMISKKLFLHRIILNHTHILLTQSTQKLYYGLYNLIELDSPLEMATLTHEFKHSYTHYRLHVYVYESHYTHEEEFPTLLAQTLHNPNTALHPLNSIHSLPLSILCLKGLRGYI